MYYHNIYCIKLNFVKYIKSCGRSSDTAAFNKEIGENYDERYHKSDTGSQIHS